MASRRAAPLLILAVVSTTAVGWNVAAPAQTLPTVTVAVQTSGGAGASCTADGGILGPEVIEDTSFTVSAEGELTQPLEVALSWTEPAPGDRYAPPAVPGTDFPPPPASITLDPDAPAVTITAEWNGQRDVTFTLTVLPGRDYLVGVPSSATAVTATAMPSCPVPPSPSPPLVPPVFTG